MDDRGFFVRALADLTRLSGEACVESGKIEKQKARFRVGSGLVVFHIYENRTIKPPSHLAAKKHKTHKKRKTIPAEVFAPFAPFRG